MRYGSSLSDEALRLDIAVIPWVENSPLGFRACDLDYSFCCSESASFSLGFAFDFKFLLSLPVHLRVALPCSICYICQFIFSSFPSIWIFIILIPNFFYFIFDFRFCFYFSSLGLFVFELLYTVV